MIKPSYDLSNLKTNHDIVLFVRDQILEPMNLRIRLYPSFVKQSHKCKTREELLVLVKKVTLRARELSQELAKESIPLKKDNGTRNGIPFATEIKKNYFLKYRVKDNDFTLTKRTGYILSIIENLEDLLENTTNFDEIEPKGEKAQGFLELLQSFQKKSGITKKVTSPKRLHKQEKTLVDSSPRERDLSPPSTPSNLKGNTDLTKLGLSVWEQLHRYTPDVADPERTARLAYYSKYQDIIKDVIDRFQVITASDGVTKNNEAELKPVSFKVLSRLLNDLYTDGFLELEAIKCGLRNPAYVFSTARCSKERFNRYTKRFRDSEQHKIGVTKKGTRQNMSHEQKVNKVLTHNEAVKKGTVKLKEQQEKEFIETAKKRKKYKPTPRTKKIPEALTDDQLMINLISKMKPEQVQHDIKNNPRFKAEYDRLKGEGLL